LSEPDVWQDHSDDHVVAPDSIRVETAFLNQASAVLGSSSERAPHKKPALWPKMPLDRIRCSRGRPQAASAASVLGRARHLKFVLERPRPGQGRRRWVRRIIRPLIVAAQGTDELKAAFAALRGDYDGEDPYERLFGGLEGPLLETIRDRDFPKSFAAQVRFVARSLTAHGTVTSRRSRAICDAEHKTE
jgi:hypothetical protein